MRNLQVNFKNLNSNQPLSISLSGNLTSKSAIEFKSNLLKVLEEKRNDCYLNISALNQLDVTGVNALAMAHKTAQALGKKFYIVTSGSDAAYEFLHLTKFINYFNFKRA